MKYMKKKRFVRELLTGDIRNFMEGFKSNGQKSSEKSHVLKNKKGSIREFAKDLTFNYSNVQKVLKDLSKKNKNQAFGYRKI